MRAHRAHPGWVGSTIEKKSTRRGNPVGIDPEWEILRGGRGVVGERGEVNAEQLVKGVKALRAAVEWLQGQFPQLNEWEAYRVLYYALEHVSGPLTKQQLAKLAKRPMVCFTRPEATS